MSLAPRSIVWTATLACGLLVAAANTLCAVVIGFDLSSMLLLTMVPVGLMALGAATTAGFVVAAQRARLEVNVIDLIFLMLLCASLVFLVYGCEFLALGHRDGQTFSHFVGSRITGARYLMRGRGMPDGPAVRIGEFGWVLMMIKTGCMLAIARFAYSVVNRNEARWAV
jgi:hypothetical protein